MCPTSRRGAPPHGNLIRSASASRSHWQQARSPSYLTLAEIDQDQGQLWLARQIKARYGVSEVFADAWSAPAFMKTNDSAISGGTVCGVPGAKCRSGDWRRAYANYLVQYAKDYAAAGVPLSYLGPENETTISPPQDSMIMSHGRQAASFSLRGLNGARVTPYLTDASHQLSAQASITVRRGAFTATLPPGSLVTYDIRS